MTPREYLRTFRFDERLATGGYVPDAPVHVAPGDTVGVVLLSEGGPAERGDLERFLYDRYMDPAAFDLPVRGYLRHRVAQFLARRGAPRVGRGYELIGGASPLIRHTKDQSRALQARLNARAASGTPFRVYIAMRHGPLRTEGAVRRMVKDGVTKVVLVPLNPQYSSTTTGSALAYWDALETTGHIPQLPSSLVPEYATHPKYVRALRDRVEEGLQRFPREVRARVPVVFVAPTTSRRAHTRSQDPYCCLVHATVDAVLADGLQPGRSVRVAFHSEMVPGRGIRPDLVEVLESLSEEGHSEVLVVPIGGVCDHVDTAYGLDVSVRARAVELGFASYEVASSLNCHPLLIDALADVALAGVTLDAGDGAVVPRPVTTTPVLCQRCGRTTAPRAWAEPSAPRPADPPELRPSEPRPSGSRAA